MARRLARGASTRASRLIKAPREAVYDAFIDGDLLAAWLPPGTMRGEIHAFEPHEGGRIRMSLTYRDRRRASSGKTSGPTDTFHGRFVELVPNQRIVWAVEFESKDPAFAGVMKVIWELAEAKGGTEVTVICEDLPRGIRPEDNEAGSNSSLEKLATLLERDRPTTPPKKGK